MRTRWASAGWSCTSGSSLSRRSGRCTAGREGRSMPALLWSRSAGQTSGPPSWAATCWGRFVVRGRMSPGGAGGARIPPTTIRYSSLPTTRASHSRWRQHHLPFVSDGIESALTQAKDAARGRDVWLAGGGSVVNQYLAARLVNEIDVSIAPLILGAGARLFEGLDRRTLKLTQIRAVDAPGVTHVKYELS